MPHRLIHLTFPYHGPWGEQMAAAFNELAEDIGRTPGLLWKVWTENRAEGLAGGTYLFESADAAQAYLTAHLPRLAAFGITDVRLEQHDANQALSTLNRALPRQEERPGQTQGAYTTLADVGHQGIERFLQTFTREGQALRAAHGSRGAAVWTVRGDANRAMVLIDWRDEQSFRNFRADPAVPPTMQQGGATRPPVFTALEAALVRSPA
jgi:heme-degrading monooxygenase HmoA